MSCGTTSATAQITEAEFNSIGFFKVGPSGLQETYVKEQYKLIYDTVTYRVVVMYTAGTTIVSYDYVSITNNFSTLQANLRLNGIIV